MPIADRSSSERGQVALSLTVHQPDGRLQALAEAVLPALLGRYGVATALCTAPTHEPLVDLLRQQGAGVEMEARPPAGIESLGVTKRETLRLGLSAGASHVHMCDFDRALHWAARYPAELDDVIVDALEFDYLVLGRTARAWDSHPAYQRRTEWLFNHVFGLISGQPWDIGAGSRIVSQRAGALLLARSTEPSVASMPNGPYLSGQILGCGWDTVSVRGWSLRLLIVTCLRLRPRVDTKLGWPRWKLIQVDGRSACGWRC